LTQQVEGSAGGGGGTERNLTKTMTNLLLYTGTGISHHFLQRIQHPEDICMTKNHDEKKLFLT
jgi:hypothetical protein